MPNFTPLCQIIFLMLLLCYVFFFAFAYNAESFAVAIIFYFFFFSTANLEKLVKDFSVFFSSIVAVGVCGPILNLLTCYGKQPSPHSQISCVKAYMPCALEISSGGGLTN